MGKVIVITSGKGGVGKTTTAINLAAALNALDEDVLIVDANLTTPNVGLHLGAPIVPVSLNHILNGKAEIEDAIYKHESGTKVIPSSLSIKESSKINGKKLANFTKKLKKYSGFIILDSSAGLGEEALKAIEAAEELIIVTNPELPAVTDALKTIKTAEKLGKDVKGVIVNRVKKEKGEMKLSAIEDMLELPILGIVPEDKHIKRSLALRDAAFHIYPKAKVSKAYRKIAAKIAGKPELKEGFWRSLFG